MAIPFNLPAERDPEDHHYLRIENLLKELLTLLRWTPWTSLAGTVSVETSSTTTAEPTGQRRRQTARCPDHHRRSTGAQQQQQQQQQQLPDLIRSCTPKGVAFVEKKSTRTVFLQVELCPTCYYNRQKLKVLGVTKLEKSSDDQQQQQTQTDQNRVSSPRITQSPTIDMEDAVAEDSSKVKRRLMSLLQPSKIDSSILTAVFVIIGWKMFIKQ